MCRNFGRMPRTQIQLPDELYRRAKNFAAERELSLAEITRRGLELFLDRFPESAPRPAKWQLPRVNGGGIKVPLAKLRDMTADDETVRSSRRR